MKALKYAVLAVVRAELIREAVGNFLIEFSSTPEQVNVACIEEVENKFGFLMDGEEELIVGLVQRELEGSPKAKGRTPKAKDWQSYIETCQSRLPLYPNKWDKGGEGGLWLSQPEIVVNSKTKGWLRLADAWGSFLKVGVPPATVKGWAYSTKATGEWGRKGPIVRPTGYRTWLRTRNWSNWDKPSAFRRRVSRALSEDMEYGWDADSDVIQSLPFTSMDGVAYKQVVLVPDIGDWDEEASSGFRIFCRMMNIQVGISVVMADDAPDDPDVCICCGYHHPKVAAHILRK